MSQFADAKFAMLMEKKETAKAGGIRQRGEQGVGRYIHNAEYIPKRICFRLQFSYDALRAGFSFASLHCFSEVPREVGNDRFQPV